MNRGQIEEHLMMAERQEMAANSAASTAPAMDMKGLRCVEIDEQTSGLDRTSAGAR